MVMLPSNLQTRRSGGPNTAHNLWTSSVDCIMLKLLQLLVKLLLLPPLPRPKVHSENTLTS